MQSQIAHLEILEQRQKYTKENFKLLKQDMKENKINVILKSAPISVFLI